MMELILGKPHSDRSNLMQREALQKAKQNPFGQVWYIVPEQYTLQMQRELIRQNNNQGLLNLEVLSFNRFVYRFQNELQTAGKVALKGSAKASLVYRLLEENAERFPVLAGKRNSHAYIQNIVSMLTECYQYRLTGEHLKEIAEGLTGELIRDKTRDLAKFFELYQEVVKSDYFMVEALLEEVCQVLRMADLSQTEIYVDGFYGFVPMQLELLSVFMQKAKQLHIGLPYDMEDENNLNLHDLRSPAELFYEIKNTISKLRDYNQNGQEKIRIIIDRLKQVTPAMLKLQDELFRREYPATEAEQDIILAEAVSPEEEIRFVAEEILKQVHQKKYRFGDMAVLVGDLQGYASKIRQIFDQYHLTYFLDQKEPIHTHPLIVFLQSGLHCVLSRFRYDELMQHLKSCYIFRSEHDKKALEAEISRLDIFAVEHGLMGINSYLKLEGLSDDLRQILEDLETLEKELKRGKTFSQKQAALENYITKKGIYEQLELQVKEWEAPGEWVKASQYRQVGDRLQDYLADMANLMANPVKDTAGNQGEENTPKQELKPTPNQEDEAKTEIADEVISTSDFVALILSGLLEMEYASAPPVPDQIIVGSLEHTRLPKTKVLFAIGLGESSVPSVQADSGFFSDWERQSIKKLMGEKYQMAQDRKISIFKAQMTIYMSLMSASEKIYFSYSAIGSGGKVERPAYLYYQVRRMFPQNPVINLMKWWKEHESVSYPDATLVSFLKQLQNGGENPNFFRVYQSLLASDKAEWINKLTEPQFVPEESIGKNQAAELYHSGRRLSVSRLESFSSCPFLHFIRYGLRAREIRPYQAERVDMGIFLHKVLETAFLLTKQKGKQIFELEEEEYQEILKQSIAIALANDKRNVFEKSARSMFLADRLSEIADRAIRTAKNQMAQGKMNFYKEEVRFSKDNMAGVHFYTEEGEEFYLEGVIDRIDVCQDGQYVYFSILDYKTGQNELDYTRIYYGLQLQLLIYLSAGENYLQKAEKKDSYPVSAAYFHMKNPVFAQANGVETAPSEAEFMNEMRLRGVFVAEQLEKLDQKVTTGQQSDVMKIRLKKDGTPYASAMVLPAEVLRAMENFAHRKVEELASRIWKGDTAVKPYSYNKYTPCSYCEYQGICKVDLKDRPHRYLAKMEKEDILMAEEEVVKSVEQARKAEKANGKP